MSSASKKKVYFPALDSLRFFASLNIILLHFSSSSLLTYAKGTFFWQLSDARYFSTNVFFLLSGFIFSIMFSEQGKVPKLKPFLKKRFWRLYPLHIICTLIFFAITLYRTNLLDNTAYAIQTLALHVSLLWAFVPKLGHHLNMPSWALSIFFLCYILTPAFSAFLNKRGKKTIWLLFVISWLILLLAVLYFEELPNIFRSIIFFSGMLLGRLFIGKNIPLPKSAWLNDLLLLIAAVLLYVNVCYFRQISAKMAYYIVSPILYCGFLLFLANGKGIIAKICSLSWLRAIGKASFYPYLLHGVVIELLHLYLDKVLHWKINIFNNPLATAMIMVLLYGSCTMYSLWKQGRRI